MLSVVYSSSATTEFSEADLAALLVASRANNARDDLTGVLAYRDGRFLQLLEGPLESVRERMRIIEKDPRHEAVTVLLEEVTQRRSFPDWTMGYERVDDERADAVPGYRATFDGLGDGTPSGGTLLALRQLVGWYSSRADAGD